MSDEALAASPEDLELVARLLDGDEGSFRALVETANPQMLRLARMYVPSRALAEEVVQEAWVEIIKGLPRFEGRSTLRTWMFRIVANTAKTRGQREGRSLPFSSLAGHDLGEPAVSPDRFLPADHRWPGHWSTLPSNVDDLPEERLLGTEAIDRVRGAIDSLPPMQAEVIRMRDVQGLRSTDVCNVLGLSETNQRVLLHRARAKVRQALERYFEES
jgi:RNA polymerase sigma-70 factor (ECF subfamily)